MINRSLFTKDKLNKEEQFRKNMIELEEQDSIYGSECDYKLSEVIFEDLLKHHKIKIKTLSDYKGCNDFNYDSINAIYKEIERNHRYWIFAIAMLNDKIIIRGKIQKDDPSGHYRRKEGIKLKPGPKPKNE